MPPISHPVVDRLAAACLKRFLHRRHPMARKATAIPCYSCRDWSKGCRSADPLAEEWSGLHGLKVVDTWFAEVSIHPPMDCPARQRPRPPGRWKKEHHTQGVEQRARQTRMRDDS